MTVGFSSIVYSSSYVDTGEIKGCFCAPSIGFVSIIDRFLLEHAVVIAASMVKHAVVVERVVVDVVVV